MIDLHAHILAGVDDGARSLEESIRMCQIGYQDGVRTIVATPHTLNGVYVTERETILSKVAELNETLRKFGVNHSAIRNPQSAIGSELRILPGADVHLTEKTVAYLDEGKLMTVGDGKKYLFIEFPSQVIPLRTEEVLFELVKRGVVPIITHPERNLEIIRRPQRYYEMIRMGCLGQVTAMSLTGAFGPKVKQVADKLLKNRLIHFIASDAHSTDGRPPILSGGVRAAQKIVGPEEARKMVTENPRAILDGLKPDIPEPIAL